MIKINGLYKCGGSVNCSRRAALSIFIILAVLLSVTGAHAQMNFMHQEIEQLMGSVKKAEKPGIAKSQLQRDQARKEQPRYSVADDGHLSHIGAPPSHYFPVMQVVPGKPAETAHNFLLENRDLFGAKSLRVNFKIKKSRERKGRWYERFQQTYDGIPVFAAEVIVQLNELDGVEYVLSDISRDTKALDEGVLSTDPSVSDKEAIKIVRGLIAGEYPDIVIDVTTPQLTVFDPSVLGSTGPVRIVWDMKALSEDEAYAIKIDRRILVDAHSGETVREYPLVKHELHRHIIDAENTSQDIELPLARDEDDPPTGIEDVDNAYDLAGVTYNYYFTEHERDSFNGGGHNIKVTVRYCDPDDPCPWSNASWLEWRRRIYFGEGNVFDDTFGHEFTHAVTSYESELVGENQSGAINESFSDIFGEFVDRSRSDIGGFDRPDTLWKHGEGKPWHSEDDLAGDGIPETGTDCGNLKDDDGDGFPDEGCPDSCSDGIENGIDGDTDFNDNECYLRNLEDPPSRSSWLDGQWRQMPDRMGHPDFYTGSDDDGGEHHNCGVGNKLAYLLTDGDIFNGQTVTGMGIERTADLYYEVNVNLLSSGADYFDLGDALEHAAVILGWNPQERGNLYKAQLAVEIHRRKDIYISGTSGCILPTGNMECEWVPPDIYIDGYWKGGPLHSITDALGRSRPGDRFFIKTGKYDERITFEDMIDIEVWGEGSVIIGE
jgi:Zn-dependent metalloprotease